MAAALTAAGIVMAGSPRLAESTTLRSSSLTNFGAPVELDLIPSGPKH